MSRRKTRARGMWEIVKVGGTYSDGSPVVTDAVTVAALDIQARRLGYSLTIVQGSYHAGVSQSAGTHDKGRCVDLAPFDAEHKEHAGRAVGFASYHRTPAQGNWSEHVHQGLLIAGVADTDHTADLLAQQLKGYRMDPPRNGLGPFPFGEDHGWHPTPRVEFDWDAYKAGRYDDKGRLHDEVVA